MSASLATLHERAELREAVRLSAIEDPEDDPFKSKYEAREQLQRVQADYVAQLIPFVGIVGECAADSQKAEIAACLGAVEVMLGNNHIHCEELSAGEKLLQEAIEHLKLAPVTLVCCELIDAYNSLGILWSHRNEHQKSKHWIQLAMDVYNQLKDGELTETRRSKVESLYTHTLFYMAQACQHTGEVERAVDLCQQTIDRQLNEAQPDLSECAKNCMFLATYYLTRRHFRQVQYFLSAADLLFSQVPPPTGGSTEAHDTMKATLARARADFSLQWLKISAEQLIRQQKSSEFEIVNDMIFTFSKLEVPEPPPYQLATNFDEARPIFMQAQTHFNRALEHYVLDGFVTDHIALLQEQSGAYKTLIVFETDNERKIKMQKKRASLLEALPAQLNQQIYIDICRQLQFELGEIYADIAELRMAEAHTPTELQKTMKKVNDNLATALNHFKHFCKLIEKNGAVPQSADADLVHAYLTARMHIGRLHGKFLLPDSPALVECMAASLKEYQAVKEIATAHPNALPLFEQELAVVTEMVDLLPMKIDALRSRLR